MIGLLIALIIMSTAFLLWNFGAGGRTLLDIAIIIGSITPYIIRRIPRLYLGLCKAAYAIKNTPATWEMSVQFKQVPANLSLESLSDQLIQWGGNESALIAKTPNRVVVRLMRRFILELYMPVPTDNIETENNGFPELALSMSPITVGYRDSKRFLDNELLPLVEKIQGELRSSWVSFGMRVDLPERNPYYGFYLQQLKLDAIKDFKIEFVLPGHNEFSRVTVSKDRLTIVSDTIEGFRLAIAAALAFKVPEVKSCQ
jgi:hypothetical protein